MNYNAAYFGNSSLYCSDSFMRSIVMEPQERRQLKPASGARGLDQIQGTASPHSSSTIDLSRFTTWGNGLSLGRLVGGAVRLPGRGLEKLGEYCEGSDWRGVHYFGVGARSLGSLIGAIGSIVGQVITLSERLFLNSLKGLGGVALVMAGAIALPFGNTSLFDRGVSWLKDAWMTRGEAQDVVPWHGDHRARAADLAESMLVAEQGCFDFLDGWCEAMGAEQEEGATVSQDRKIPERWQSRYTCLGDDGSFGVISGLSVPVGVRWGEDGTVFIAFPGMHDGRSFVSALLGAIGVVDETFRKAREVVQDFAAQYPGKVHVLGHSLGGALAQFSGIKADVPVTCFNSMGLPAGLTDRLVDISEVGQGKLTRARVEHFNSNDDWLAQKLQTRFAPFGLSQLGCRHKVAEARGHFMYNLACVL